MDTRNEVPPPVLADWFNPLAGWEAASRWNRSTFDWVAKGWQQWMALMTTMPPHFVIPPTLEPHAQSAPMRTLQPLERAMARADAPRVARTKAKAKKPTARTRKTKG